MVRMLEFSIQQGDITLFNADVVALKYAQAFYGTDQIIADRLNEKGTPLETLCPSIGESCYIDTQGSISARYALFIGVPPLSQFTYQHIQEFAKDALAALSKKAPMIEHLAMTIHGVGFGLDESEAALAQFTGYLAAIQQEQLPTHLKSISIIDIDLNRIQRLRQIFTLHLDNVNYAFLSSKYGTHDLDVQKLQDMFKRNYSYSPTDMLSARVKKTEAEISLLDIFSHLDGMEIKEQHIRLTVAVNALLKEAVHSEYSLNFTEHDGIYLHTPSGLILWLVPEHEKYGVLKISIYDNYKDSSQAFLSKKSE